MQSQLGCRAKPVSAFMPIRSCRVKTGTFFREADQFNWPAWREYVLLDDLWIGLSGTDAGLAAVHRAAAVDSPTWRVGSAHRSTWLPATPLPDVLLSSRVCLSQLCVG